VIPTIDWLFRCQYCKHFAPCTAELVPNGLASFWVENFWKSIKSYTRCHSKNVTWRMHIDFASLRLWPCERAQGMLTNIFQGTIWRQYWWKKKFFYPDDLERFSLKGPVPWARSRSMYCTVGVEWFFRSSWSLGMGGWGSIRISDRSFAGVKLERVQISSQKFTLLLHWIGHFFWPADLSIWKIRRHHLGGGHRMEKSPLLVYNAQQRKVFQSNFWKLSSSQLEKSVDSIMLAIEWAIDLYHFYSNRSIISGAIQVTNSNLQWAGSWFIIFLCNEWRSKDDQREKNDQN
jgi:hypothetical protein